MMVQTTHTPSWLVDFQKQAKTNEVGSFVFHHNVWDDHLVDGNLVRIYEAFAQKEPTNRAAMIAYFNFETGLRFADEEGYETTTTVKEDRGKNVIGGDFTLSPMKELFLRFISSGARDLDIEDEDFLAALGVFEGRKRAIGYVLAWLRTALRLGWASEPIQGSLKVQDILFAQDEAREVKGPKPKDDDSPEKRGKILERRHQEDPFLALIFETPKLLAPSATGAQSSAGMDDRVVLDHFAWWAQEKTIRYHRNLILYLTEALQDLPEELRKGVHGFYNVRVGVPDEEEMPLGIGLIRKDYPKKDDDVSDEDLAFLARGMEFKVVRRILADAHASGEVISRDLMFDQKSKNFIEQTGGLARLIRHEGHTYDMLGSLNYVVDGLKATVRYIRAGRWGLVPRGVLYMGSRGTAKSETVKVVASQSGITCAEMVTIREMWVGQSERNLELFLQKARDNAPMFIIQDEADATWQSRDRLGDNTGVNQHMTGMMLDFMGDESVQGIVWFFLTNKPHHLDSAMIRSLRIDERYLFTVVGVQERPAVIQAILRQLEVELPRSGEPPFTWELSKEEIETLAGMMDFEISQGTVTKGPPKASKSQRITLNGAEIKKVLKRANDRAFLEGHDALRFAHIDAVLDRLVPEYTEEDRLTEQICLAFVDDLDHVPDRLREEVMKRKAKQFEGSSANSGPR